jgi:flagellar hook-associated protein 2
MDPLPGIYSNNALVGILASQAPSYALLSSELSLSMPKLFANSTTWVGISARGQLLSASVTFQNRLQPLRTDTAATPDLETLTANAQSLVGAFNTLQTRIADINSLANLPLGGVTGAPDLARSLDRQALATYANGDSALTQLAQIGIGFKASPLPGGSSQLTLDTERLAAAYTSDAAGTSALIGKVADALNTVAGSFIARSGTQYPSLDTLMQTDSGALSNLSRPPGFNLLDFVSALPQGGTGWRQAYAAINEYNMVSHLFG